MTVWDRKRKNGQYELYPDHRSQHQHTVQHAPHCATAPRSSDVCTADVLRSKIAAQKSGQAHSHICRCFGHALGGQQHDSLALALRVAWSPAKASASAVPCGATEGDSLTLLTGGAPACEGDDLAHSWEAPVSTHYLPRARAPEVNPLDNTVWSTIEARVQRVPPISLVFFWGGRPPLPLSPPPLPPPLPKKHFGKNDKKRKKDPSGEGERGEGTGGRGKPKPQTSLRCCFFFF